MKAQWRSGVWAMAGTIGLATVVMAQEPVRNPAEAVTKGGADMPITAVEIADPELLALAKMFTGSFKAAEQGDRPALWFNAAPVQVSGLDNATYFEVTRSDSPSDVVQQGVLHLFRTKAGMRLRMFGFQGSQGAPLVGLWTVPDSMPGVDAKMLYPVMDMTLKTEGGSKTFTGATACNYPVNRGGAIEARSAITIAENELVLEDEGFNGAGERVWGAIGKDAPKFTRSTSPVTGKTLEGGLVVVTMAQPGADAEKLGETGEIVVHYSGWLTDGREFDSSRRPGREPFKLRMPGGVIKGWNEGLKGIAKGERRRLLIPSEMAYGARGRPPVIAPNSILVFDVECLMVSNQPAPAQPKVDERGMEVPPTNTPPGRPQPATGTPK